MASRTRVLVRIGLFTALWQAGLGLSAAAVAEDTGLASKNLSDLHLPSLIPSPFSNPEILGLIVKAYRRGDAVEAAILQAGLDSPAAQAAGEWFVIRSGLPASFERITAFRQAYPDWPTSFAIRRRSEEALLMAHKPSPQIRQFFTDQPPLTSDGRAAFAFALQADGFEKEATAQIRFLWREEVLRDDLEKRILDRFSNVLTQADHHFRLDQLLFKEAWVAAGRAAGYAGKGYETLMKARLSLAQTTRKAQKAFDAVPAFLRSDASYIFTREVFDRRNGKLDDALKILTQTPQDSDWLVDGDSWWAERRLMMRALLDKGDSKEAYALAQGHGAETPLQRIEAEFSAGWIALRFLSDPQAAAGHFASAASLASTPLSRARAAYWQGRTAEAIDKPEDAKLFYERAAEAPTAYYGQLAISRLGRELELRTPPILTEDGRRAFEAMIPVQAADLLEQAGEGELALGLYIDLAQTLTDPAQIDALARMAAARQDPRAVLAIGKAALQRGLPLDIHAYPLMGIPEFDAIGSPVEPAMIYSIARQESAFNSKASSGVGARGLMQLMLATAKDTAQHFGLAYNPDRLLSDPAYNVKLGAAYLGSLLADWKGSPMLAFASYNAGAGNVKKWIAAYGDPRDPSIDPVDWIERIPFYETRNYVQRVMENLAVYRRRLENPTAQALGDPSRSRQAAQD